MSNADMKTIEAFRQGFAYRMSLLMRVQHFLFALCLTVLALTGLALMFYDTAFGRFLMWLEGGFQARGLIHRIAAVVLSVLSVFHVGYLFFTRSGRSEFRDRTLAIRDLKNLAALSRYQFGRSKQRPLIGKFGPGQKLHFWLAGIVVLSMMITGFILWFPTTAMTVLPQWIMRIVLIAHGYEGLIAFVILVLWHLYDIHLSPRHFPMSMVWLTGLMSLDETKEYHPLEYERIEKLVRDHEN
jgi:formate dehydrogenase gamma subunit